MHFHLQVGMFGASGLLIRKGRKARKRRKSEAEPKMLIDFPKSQQRAID